MMGLFGKMSDIWDLDPFSDKPSILEQVDMIFTDVETEGKKNGYEKASREYEKVYRELEFEYQETKTIIERQKNNYDIKSDELIRKLRGLESEKADLERRVNSKANDVSNRYNIPISDVKNALITGSLIASESTSTEILNLVFQYKERKLKEAEQKGYVEARNLYEGKISKLKDELRRLERNGNRDLQGLLALINDLYAAIADEQMKIAELNILL